MRGLIAVTLLYVMHSCSIPALCAQEARYVANVSVVKFPCSCPSRRKPAASYTVLSMDNSVLFCTDR